MLNSVQIIRNICPELAANPETLNFYLQMSTESLDVHFFKKRYAEAVAYKAAHLYTLFGSEESGSIGANPVSGMHEGGLSINYAVSSNAKNSDLELTKFGKMLLSLIDQLKMMNTNRFF